MPKTIEQITTEITFLIDDKFGHISDLKKRYLLIIDYLAKELAKEKLKNEK